MEKLFAGAITDINVRTTLERIFDNAFGNPIIFTSVPTNETMKANTWGYYSSELYIKFANGVCLKFTGTVVS